MDNSRENSFCCGSCGGLPRVSKNLSDNIAKERILQAKRIGVRKMIVVGFENYSLLKENVGDSDIEILELGMILADSLEIRKIKMGEENNDG